MDNLILNTGKNTQNILLLNRDKKNISAFGVQTATRRAIFTMLDRAVLIEPDYVAARQAYDFAIGLKKDVVFLPSRSDSIGLYTHKFGDNDYERFSAISEIAGGATHVITFVEAAMQLYPDAGDVARAVIRIERGQTAEPTELAEKLVKAGYKRVPQISERGEFSVRGDIVDIYPTNGMPLRVSIDFDEIGTIKTLTDELLSSGEIDGALIAVCGEAFYEKDEIGSILDNLRKQSSKLPPDGKSRFAEKIADVEMQMQSGRLDIPLIMPLISSVPFARFMDGYTFVYADAKTCADNADLTLKEHNSRIASLMESGEAVQSSALQIVPPDKAFGGVSLTFHTGLNQNRLAKTDEVIELADEILPRFAYDYNYLEFFVRNKLSQGFTFHIFCGNQSAADAVNGFLSSKSIITGSAGGVNIYKEFLSDSFTLADAQQIYLGTPSVVARTERSSRRRREIMPVPEVGDYVVHETHGVGKCLSIEKLNLTGSERDYVIIGYAGGDKLMLPVENLDTLSKFSVADAQPKLNKLGGGQFAKIKEKVKSSIKELAVDLVALYGARQAGGGHVFMPEPAAMNEFISAFEYVDTPDQTECTNEALNDLALGKIMDRLLCGDVGFGKTEVAMRVAYRVILEGMQVAFLCPTTLLAYQHFTTVKNRMEKFGVKCAMLSRVSTPTEVKNVLAGLSSGDIDIVCGTHKLLGKEVKFSNLGLLILDEEQRFGVQHKEQLKEMKTNVNVLTMSATPIPRTLHMSLSGIRDISMLTTPPTSRLPIQTYVSEYSDSLLFDALMREKSRGGQSFVVFNRVDKINEFAAKVNKVLDGKLTLDVVHGQMPAQHAEKVIENFASGSTDVLIATTIIENGIDIPRANTMVIIDADKLGLSQIYQLRGRIGRSDRLASAYLTYEKSAVLRENAMERLNAIMQCKELGSGFILATRDLQIRGAGNVLGRQQHGHMDQVGYETYVKLLKEVVGELRGEPIAAGEEVRVRTDFDAYISTDYIISEQPRLRQYNRISRIESTDELQKIKRELTEVYGEPPSAVTNLLTVALVKNIAASLGACEVVLMKREGTVSFRKALSVPQHFANAAESAGAKITVGDKAYVRMPTAKALVKFLLNLPKQL